MEAGLNGIYRKLYNVQQELKAPKNLNNSFGGYKYRSLESILEAVKPILHKYDLALILRDELTTAGEGSSARFYVKATAKLLDVPTGQYIEATALAREALAKKGMDESQITGTASSYARKYCLNGLFAIDDTKDADTDEYRRQEEAGGKNASAPATNRQRVTLIAKCEALKVDPQEILREAGWTEGQMTRKQYTDAMEILEELT